MSQGRRVAPLSALTYVLGRGLRGMTQSIHVQGLAVGTMAVCMLLLGTTVLLWHNAAGITREWGIDVPVTVYMVDGADPDQVATLERKLHRIPELEQVDRITPAAAMQRLERGLGGQQTLLEGIDAETLPESFELHLAATIKPEFGQRLADRLVKFDEVDEVAVVGPWAQQARDLLETLRTLAVGVGMLVTIACMAIVWSTIRLGVFARRAEIHILRLVGGTHAFVRGPFVVEGLLQGAIGAGLALSLLAMGFELVRPHLESGLALVFAAGGLRFFTTMEVLAGIAFGALVGFFGARAAVGRYVEI